MASTIRRGAVLSTTAAMTLALAGLTPALAQAAGPSPRTTLDGAPAWTAHAARVGQTPATRTQHLTAVLGLRDPAGAESLAAAVVRPLERDVRPASSPPPRGAPGSPPAAPTSSA